MRSHPFRSGGLAVLAGMLAWTLEWRWEWHALNPVVLAAKVCGWVALVFCLRTIAPLLHGSWRRALSLWAILSVASLAALYSAIPFRLWMPHWANDGRRRWYYEGMPQPEGDYARWLADWHRFGPHFFEAGVLLVFFALLLAPCVFIRMRLQWAAVSCLASCAWLAIAPVSHDLLEFDYDTFQLGIALDSIALSLWPMGLAYSDAHCIFTLGFLAVIFAAVRVFFVLLPQPRHDAAITPGG